MRLGLVAFSTINAVLVTLSQSFSSTPFLIIRSSRRVLTSPTIDTRSTLFSQTKNGSPPLAPARPLPTPETQGNNEGQLVLSLIPAQDCEARRMSSTDLAYIGDCVYELFIRSQFVWPSRRTKDLQKQVVALVRGTYNPANF